MHGVAGRWAEPQGALTGNTSPTQKVSPFGDVPPAATTPLSTAIERISSVASAGRNGRGDQWIPWAELHPSARATET